MKADEIRELLTKKKKNFNIELRTTDDFARKKKAKKKYYEIRKILNEMNDAEIVSWYYSKQAEETEKQRRRDRVKEKAAKPSSSANSEVKEKSSSPANPKPSRKLADFADLDIEVPEYQSSKRSKDEIVREWISCNNFGVENNTLNEEMELEDLSSSQHERILTKIEEQKLLISDDKSSLLSPFADKSLHKRREPKVKGHSNNLNELILLLFFSSETFFDLFKRKKMSEKYLKTLLVIKCTLKKFHFRLESRKTTKKQRSRII